MQPNLSTSHSLSTGGKLPDLALGPEWAILELLCLGLKDEKVKNYFIEVLKSGDINWGELLEQAIYHRVWPNLAYHLTLEEFQLYVPRDIRWHLRQMLDVNKHKTTLCRAEVVRIGRKLQAAQVPYVNTKGIALEATLYEGKNIRYFNDIDFMIQPEHRDKVMELLEELGYAMGYFDWHQQRVLPHERRSLMAYKLSPDHIPSFAMGTQDPVIPGIKVDVANSLVWGNSPYPDPLEKAFAHINFQPVPGFSDFNMPCFAPVYQFILVTLHLFREAWVERRWLVRDGKDVNLMKFGDVVQLLQAYPQELSGEKFSEMLEQLGILEPVLWVLEHTDRVFGLTSVVALDSKTRVDEKWLSTAYNPEGDLYTWQGTMRERLQNKNRKLLFGT